MPEGQMLHRFGKKCSQNVFYNQICQLVAALGEGGTDLDRASQSREAGIVET